MTHPRKNCHSSPSIAIACLAFSLAPGLFFALPSSAAAQTPGAGFFRPKPKAKPKTHAEVHAEAHVKALAEAQAKKEKQAQEAKAQAATALYRANASKLLGAEWQKQLVNRREPVRPGKLKVRYQIRPDGDVEKIQMVDAKEASQGLVNITLLALKTVHFPRMSKEVVSTLAARPGVPAGSLEMERTFVTTAPKDADVVKMDGKSPASLYVKTVGDALAREWTRHMEMNDLKVSGGMVRMSLLVHPDGKVTHVRVMDDTHAPASFRDAAITALRATKFPPMPKELASYLERRPEGFRVLRVPCVLKGRGPSAAFPAAVPKKGGK